MLSLAADVLRRVPELIDYEGTAKLVADDMNPLNVVLLQEVYYTHTCIVCSIIVHAQSYYASDAIYMNALGIDTSVLFWKFISFMCLSHF